MELLKLEVFRRKGAKILAYMRVLPYLCGNNTCHASHKNSAPGQVLDFYRVRVYKNNTL